MEMEFNTQSINNVELVATLMTDVELRRNILAKYNIIAGALSTSRPGYQELRKEVIDNKETFAVILNETVVAAIMTTTNHEELANYTYLNDIYEDVKNRVRRKNTELEQKYLEESAINPEAKKPAKKKNYSELQKRFAGLIGEDSVVTGVTADSITQALNLYNLATTENNDNEEEADPEDFGFDPNELWGDEEGGSDGEEADWGDTEPNGEEPEWGAAQPDGADDTAAAEDTAAAPVKPITPPETDDTAEEEAEAARKKSLETGDVSGKANDLTEADLERNEELEALVDNIINNIMSTYYEIYSPLYLDPPSGVLYTNSEDKHDIMCIGRSDDNTGVKVHGNNSLRPFVRRIYKTILNTNVIKEAPKVGDDGMAINAAWMRPDGTMKYNYAPHVQVRNCMGVYRDKETGLLKRAKNWDEFSDKLIKELKPTILALLKRVNIEDDDIVSKAVKSIQEFYTTIFLVNKFDKDNSMKFTFYSDSLNSSCNLDLANDIIAADPLTKPADSYKLMGNTLNNGIRRILIVTNEEKFRGELNFAYKTIGKVLQLGGTVDLANTVVGTNIINGTPETINLYNNAYTSIGIVAGTRSGKGVLTLSLLISMLANKCPVVYLDYKPDMAGVFWELEKKYNCKALAIDGKIGILEGQKPATYFKAGFGAPKSLASKIGQYYILLPYIKGVQIMNLIGSARVAGKLNKKKKMFFVLDEAQKCGDAINAATKAIEAERDANKPKGKNPESEEYIYLKKLANMYKSTEMAATEFLNTNGGSGNMSALILGQQPEATEWRGPFSTMILKAPIKFLGRETKGGSKYGLNEKIKGVGLLGTGVFGLVKGNTPSESNTTMIKTSMVLNDADFDVATKQGGKYTGALLDNLKDTPVIQKEAIENDMIVSSSNEIALAAGYEAGTANPLVGFPGLLEYIGKLNGDFNIQEALSAGYNEVAKVLTMLGILGPKAPYPNVEAYLHSGKEDSLFTSGQLAMALASGMTIYDYIKDGGASDEDEMGGDNGEDEIIPLYGNTETNEETAEQSATSPQFNSGQSFNSNTNFEDAFNEMRQQAAQQAQQSTQSPQPQTQSSETNQNYENAFDEMRRQAAQEAQANQAYEEPVGGQPTNRNIPFMPTKDLVQKVRSGEINENTLNYYRTKYLEGSLIKGINLGNKSKNPKDNGLMTLSIIFSNMHALNRLREAGTITLECINETLSVANAELKNHNKSTLAVELFQEFSDCYTNSKLRYDVMPSEELFRAMIDNVNSRRTNGEQPGTATPPYGTGTAPQPQPINTSDFRGEQEEPINPPPAPQPQPEPQRSYSAYETDYSGRTAREAEFDRGTEPCWDDDTNGVHRFNTRSTSEVLRHEDAEIELISKIGFFEKFKKRSYESKTGMSYLVGKYWDYVLDKAAERVHGDVLRVTKVYIRSRSLTLNGKMMVPLDALLDHEDEITMEEIINIHKTFKKFPNITDLSLDASGLDALTNEYGVDAKHIWKMFQDNPKLRVLILENPNKPMVFNRSSFAATAAELDRELSEEATKKSLEAAMMASHPRLNEEPRLMHRFVQGSRGHASDYFKSAHEAAIGKNPSYGRWVGHTFLGLVCSLPVAVSFGKNKLFGPKPKKDKKKKNK